MPAETHLPQIEWRAACESGACPVCHLAGKRTAKYLDSLLWEHVTDREFRYAFRAAGGFCQGHSRDLDSFRDGLAVAILHRDILGDRLEAFRKKKAFKSKAPCVICKERERVEKTYFTLLSESAGTERAAFEASAGLCVPHYGKFLSQVRRPPKWITEIQEGAYRDLMRRVDVFIDYSAFGRDADFATLSPEDKTVWKELARALRSDFP